jgi:hypothetical protein
MLRAISDGHFRKTATEKSAKGAYLAKPFIKWPRWLGGTWVVKELWGLFCVLFIQRGREKSAKGAYLEKQFIERVAPGG